ncbi:MAG: hypothetical protein HC888_08210 [Candidatus Competibacteraceae bacterium]|nr:hypothetical protein [Candidatus Competibacteraceae bacterium]
MKLFAKRDLSAEEIPLVQDLISKHYPAYVQKELRLCMTRDPPIAHPVHYVHSFLGTTSTRTPARQEATINGVRAMNKPCPVPGCGGTIVGTSALCTRCGYKVGDDLSDEGNLSFYRSKLRRNQRTA